MISKGISNITIEDIRKITTEFDILSYYLNIEKIPCLINSPLRKDNNPSFGIYTTDGIVVFYYDYASKESGSIYNLLGKMWNTDFPNTLDRVYTDFSNKKSKKTLYTSIKSCKRKNVSTSNDSELKCRIREWKTHDIEYWESYGISLKWLKYADVYPISHIIIEKNNKEYIIPADKHAYAYVERKEGRITLKIYQPFNKKFKWSNKHDSSVISLWTKVPDKGKILCICASLKDALCLWANTGIPAVAVQGEGYSMSNTAINVLKNRFKKIFVLFDNDKTGLEDGVKLSEQTGFINLVLPEFEGGKDISDYYKVLKNKQQFKETILKLFNL